MEDKDCCNSETVISKSKVVKIKTKLKTTATTKSGNQANSTTDLKLQTEKSCCCSCGDTASAEPITKYNSADHWIEGELKTDAGLVPQVTTKLIYTDRLGAWMVRWGINRMDYKINPGIYAVGKPDKSSHVLVTANYKLTFDMLRKELDGLNLWILVLDTKGVNVWCAAGKGTFGTKELINRINKTKLDRIVSHRTLILPQLGAPGISAHEVARNTGFKVVYGTIRAKDLKEYLNSGMNATEEMRKVKFSFYDRLVLTPIELVSKIKISLIIFGILFLINLIAFNPFTIIDFYGYTGALLVGCVLTPILLPWVPGRAFSWKGWILGLIWVITLSFLSGLSGTSSSEILKAVGYILVLPSVSAFCSMNFTGSSTFTSFSGVQKEMKIAIPLIAVSVGLGSILLLINSFLRF